MELIWLVDFVTLAECSVFSRAAARRNVTQPAFTRRIKKLEYALGAVLIDRSVHPAALTPAGQKFLPVAQNIIFEWEGMRTELAATAKSQAGIRLACLQSLSVSYVPVFLRQLYRNGPQPRFRVMADNFTGCVDAITSGAADVLICYSHDMISTGSSLTGKLACALDNDRLIPVSRAVDGQPVYALDGHNVPFLSCGASSVQGRLTNAILDRQPERLSLDMVYEDSIGAAIKTAVIQGIGVAWLPEKLIEAELARGEVAELTVDGLHLSEAMAITAFRNAATAEPPVERFWSRLVARSDDPPLL
ncbi:MAG: LysR substrate-binding domain-containing protein [Paracoccus sp. (in: a-proteobacteria)]|uniref:LysR substrate-binding domain-containing protein n=1 Tax=Paracoccus sp. TaxID=267 RepID=UPI00391BABD5